MHVSLFIILGEKKVQRLKNQVVLLMIPMGYEAVIINDKEMQIMQSNVGQFGYGWWASICFFSAVAYIRII